MGIKWILGPFLLGVLELATYKGGVAISRSGNAIGLFAEIAGVILSGGISEFVKNITGTLLTMAQATAISLAVGGIISLLYLQLLRVLQKLHS